MKKLCVCITFTDPRDPGTLSPLDPINGSKAQEFALQKGAQLPLLLCQNSVLLGDIQTENHLISDRRHHLGPFDLPFIPEVPFSIYKKKMHGNCYDIQVFKACEYSLRFGV
jgi:hypothetical protein